MKSSELLSSLFMGGKALILTSVGDSAELVQCEHELRGAQTNIDMSREGTNQLGGKLKHVIR